MYHLSLPVGAVAEIKAVAEDEIEQGLTDYNLRYMDILTSWYLFKLAFYISGLEDLVRPPSKTRRGLVISMIRRGQAIVNPPDFNFQAASCKVSLV